jgi:hypothetical protein
MSGKADVPDKKCGFIEMLPKPIIKVFSFFGRALVWTYQTICDASWVFFTIGLIMLAPAAFEREREVIQDNAGK